MPPLRPYSTNPTRMEIIWFSILPHCTSIFSTFNALRDIGCSLNFMPPLRPVYRTKCFHVIKLKVESVRRLSGLIVIVVSRAVGPKIQMAVSHGLSYFAVFIVYTAIKKQRQVLGETCLTEFKESWTTVVFNIRTSWQTVSTTWNSFLHFFLIWYSWSHSWRSSTKVFHCDISLRRFRPYLESDRHSVLTTVNYRHLLICNC